MVNSPIESKVNDVMGHPRRKNKQGKPKTVMRVVIELLIKVVIILIVVNMIFTFIFGVKRVNDDSMMPNIMPGDVVVYYRLNNTYTIGDVVMYKYKNTKHAARIAALPGYEITIDKAGLKVNGSVQYEPRIFKNTLAFNEGVSYPVKLRSDEYFLLGDNRDKTVDSRLFGAIQKENLYGKVIILIRRREI